MGAKIGDNSLFADTLANRLISQRVGLLLGLFALVSGFYASYIVLGYNWVWYSWHPISMISSFVALAGNAVLIKKIGGYENTKKHGYIMVAATMLAIFGWFVIYSNKNMQGKNAKNTLSSGRKGAPTVADIVVDPITQTASDYWAPSAEVSSTPYT